MTDHEIQEIADRLEQAVEFRTRVSDDRRFTQFANGVGY